jgi:hypothetical protein
VCGKRPGAAERCLAAFITGAVPGPLLIGPGGKNVLRPGKKEDMIVETGSYLSFYQESFLLGPEHFPDMQPTADCS